MDWTTGFTSGRSGLVALCVDVHGCAPRLRSQSLSDLYYASKLMNWTHCGQWPTLAAVRGGSVAVQWRGA